MSEYGFCLTRIFPYKDRIEDSKIFRTKRNSRNSFEVCYFTTKGHHGVKYIPAYHENERFCPYTGKYG